MAIVWKELGSQSYFIPHLQCQPVAGGTHAQAILNIPDEVKLIKIGNAYKSGSYSGMLFLYNLNQSSPVNDYNLSEPITDLIIDVSSMTGVKLQLYSFGTSEQSGYAVLKNVEMVF